MPTLGETPGSEPVEELPADRGGTADADRLKVKKPSGWSKLKNARSKTRERRKRNIDPTA
jgi:hypothetical protein